MLRLNEVTDLAGLGGSGLKKKRRKKRKTGYLTMEPYKYSRRYLREQFKKQQEMNKERQRRINPGVTIVEYKSHLKDLEEKPGRKELRIFFQNVNTLKLGKRIEETDTAMKILRGAGVSIFGLSEVNKNLAHPEVVSDFENLLRRTMPGAEYVLASNNEYVPRGKHKPGGVMMATSRHINKYVNDRSVDKKGRWAKTSLRMGGGGLTVYNVYVPLKDDGGGSTTIKRQLQNSLDNEGILEDPREHLYNQLKEDIEKEVRRGNQVLVGGDFNETMEENSKMQGVFDSLGMENVFYSRMEEVPATRSPGSRTIDHVWATSECFDRIKGCGLVAQDKVFLTDHLGTFVDVYVGEVDKTEEEAGKARRYLKSGNKKGVRKYVEYVSRQVKHANLRTRIEKLKKNIPRSSVDEITDSLNKLDEKLQTILISGEKILRPKMKEAFSMALVKARSRRRYWRVLARSGRKLSHNGLLKMWSGHKEAHVLLTDEEIRKKLAEADEEVQCCYWRQVELRESFLNEKVESLKGEREKMG